MSFQGIHIRIRNAHFIKCYVFGEYTNFDNGVRFWERMTLHAHQEKNTGLKRYQKEGILILITLKLSKPARHGLM